MANITEYKLIFLETMMPVWGHFKLCCCQKQSKFSLKRKKERNLPQLFLVCFILLLFFLAFGHCQMWNAMSF